MIEIILLGKPVAKGRPRFNRESGRAYTPAKTVKYETMLRYAAVEVMGARPPLEGPLRLEMHIVVPIPASWPKKKQAAARAGELRPTGKPDLDNFMKVIDSCNLVVWIDDGQITDSTLRKTYGDKPRVEIRVWPTESPTNHGVFE
jgi:Holliday junction resolvase RusA-like endonuclease